MDPCKKKFDSILETIGHTPVVKIKKLAPAHVSLYVKIEAFNPMGSVKDRLALGVIEDAERSGSLKPGQTVVTEGQLRLEAGTKVQTGGGAGRFDGAAAGRGRGGRGRRSQ